MAEKMGFEGLTYYGTAGSTASTPIVIIRDTTYSVDPTKASTTSKGAGTSAPIETEDVVSLKFSYDFNLTNDITDAAVAALWAAAVAGTPVALRTKDHASGKGFDGDVTLSVKNGAPLAGEQTFDFTATPTKKSGRAPVLYT